ncbi:MAG TPA: LD-carboxypeptidase [Blastocatellia bacterium]|nr:LD-carboxypeptidase [Blastocatellia bacterium]
MGKPIAICKPSALQPGDTIAVVAPASNLKPDWLSAGEAELHRLGFKTKHLDSIFSKALYTAGSDQRRAQELNAMFADPDVKAIFAARGGYGTVRALSGLDDQIIRDNPKIFMGYSDVTTLLIYLYQRHGLVTFHGPMVAKDFRGGPSHYDGESFNQLLVKGSANVEINVAGAQVLIKGKARGRLLGGCMPMITASIGTPYELDTTDAILLLEDVAAKPYQIDRMIQHLRLAGKLDSVRGFVFGEMNECVQGPNQGYTIEEVILDCLGDLGLPILFGLTTGHTEHNNLTLPLGVEVELDCDASSLTIVESAVNL